MKNNEIGRGLETADLFGGKKTKTEVACNDMKKQKFISSDKKKDKPKFPAQDDFDQPSEGPVAETHEKRY